VAQAPKTLAPALTETPLLSVGIARMMLYWKECDSSRGLAFIRVIMQLHYLT
jgi:hypothetical protein